MVTKNMEEEAIGKQLALWAYSLSFKHPTTKEELTFEDYPEKIGSWKILD